MKDKREKTTDLGQQLTQQEIKHLTDKLATAEIGEFGYQSDFGRNVCIWGEMTANGVKVDYLFVDGVEWDVAVFYEGWRGLCRGRG